jgi:hypothetical protein
MAHSFLACTGHAKIAYKALGLRHIQLKRLRLQSASDIAGVSLLETKPQVLGPDGCLTLL